MSTHSHRSRRTLLVLGGVAGTVSLVLVLPFLTWILVGAILAYILQPLHNRLGQRVSEGVAAFVSILVGLLFILIPLTLIIGVAARQALQLWQTFDPRDLSQIDDLVADRLPIEVDLAVVQDSISGAVRTGLRGLTGNLFTIVGGLPELFIGFTVLLFVLFYSLKDGSNGTVWLKNVLPLDPGVQETLFEETDALLYNSLIGNVAVAGVQALLLGVAFLVLGISNLVFWTITTFVVALLPLIGATVIWVPASIYLFLVLDRPAGAAALFIYGTVIISLSDNIIRPKIMQRGTKLNPVLTIVGIFGGIALFGFVGLFIGPVILGMTKRLIEMIVEEYPDQTPAPDGPTE